MENITPNGYAWDLMESLRDINMQCDSYTKSAALFMIDKMIEELNNLGQAILISHRKARVNYLVEVKKELEKLEL